MNRGSPLALVVALVLCLAATTVGYVRAQPDAYTSTAVLSLSPRDPIEVGSDDLTLATSRYVAYLSAPATLDAVATSLGVRPAHSDDSHVRFSASRSSSPSSSGPRSSDAISGTEP